MTGGAESVTDLRGSAQRCPPACATGGTFELYWLITGGVPTPWAATGRTFGAAAGRFVVMADSRRDSEGALRSLMLHMFKVLQTDSRAADSEARPHAVTVFVVEVLRRAFALRCD